MESAAAAAAAPPRKKTVDEIWRELNAGSGVARPGPQQVPKSRTTGVLGFGIPGVSTHTRVLPAKPQPGFAAPAAADGAGGGSSTTPSHPSQPAQSYDVAAGGGDGLSGDEVAAYLATLQRTINCLSDPDRLTRRSAASSLATKLLRGDAATPKASPAMLQALLSGPLLAPVSASLTDPVEGCRLAALSLLLEAAPQLTDLGPLLQGLMPTLVSRMGQVPVQEPAEEVRLAALELLQVGVAKSSVSTLASCAPDLSLLLARGLEDAFPDAKRAAAGGLGALAAKLPPGGLEGVAERLLQALLPNLLHQHSRVRLAVLAGLRALVLSGLPAGMLESQVAPAIQQLSADHTASVREAYYAALAAWLDCGADSHQQQDGQEAAAAAAHARCRTHAPVLLPLLLLGVSDAQPSVAAATLRAVEAAGAAWQLQPAAATAAEAAGGEAVPMETDAAAGADGGLHVLPAAVAAAQLPPPYQGLPSEASRQMVAALLPQLLPQVLAGLREWTISLRSAAARLLHTCCVLGGPAAAPHLPQLLPGLVAALSDDEPDIVARLASSCRLLGAFVPPPAWLPLLVDALTDPRASPGGRASALVVTACMAHAAAAAAQPAEPALLAALVSGLASDDVLAADHAGLQAQLLIVTRNLLDWMPEAVVMQCRQQLYLVLLQLYGAAAAAPGSGAAAQPQQPGSSHSQTDNVAAVMQLLAQRTGLPGGAAQLAAQHARALLPLLTADAAKWGSASPHLVAFTALLRTAGPDCLAELLPEVALVLQPVLADADREPGLRLALLTLLDDLLEGRDTAPAFVGSEAAALLTLTHLLMPPLVWRAGKAAAAVRYAAATALSTFVASPAGAPPPAVLLAAMQPLPQGEQQQQPAGPGLLPLLAQLLDEDWFADARHTGCFVMQQVLQQVGSKLGDDARRAIYPELLKRLDDSSNRVRVAACGALVAFVRAAGASYCPTNSGYLAAGVVLHMDDSDAQVAEAACQVLEALAASQPQVAAAEVRKMQDRFGARHLCDRVLAACEAASAAQQA